MRIRRRVKKLEQGSALGRVFLGVHVRRSWTEEQKQAEVDAKIAELKAQGYKEEDILLWVLDVSGPEDVHPEECRRFGIICSGNCDHCRDAAAYNLNLHGLWIEADRLKWKGVECRF